MKQFKYFLSALLMVATFGASGQSVKLKWKQIQTGTQGQVAIVGVTGEGQWVTAPFLNLADTTAMLAAYQAAIADMQANKEDKSNKSNTTTLGTSTVLYPTQNAVKVYVDNQNSAQDAATTSSLALKEDKSNKSTATALGTSNTLYPSQNAVKVYVDNGNSTQDVATAASLALKEDLSNKSTSTSLGASNTLYPTQNAVKTYVDNGLALKANDNAVVHLAGPETMTGAKTFSVSPTVPTPTASTDAANKGYVDNLVAGATWKIAVDAATTANISIATPGFTTLDGVTLVSGSSRILVKDQTTQSQNGIYIYNGSASALTRSSDMDLWSEVPGAATFVKNGTTLAKTGWVVAGVSVSGTIGTTAMPWTQFTGAGTYSVSAPITLVGNVIGHATSGVTAGTYNSVTVNNTGHVTGGTNVGYLTAETDPIFVASDAYGITTTDRTHWTAGYNDKINSVSVSGTTTKTATAVQQDGGTVTWSWTDLQSQWTDAVQQFTGSTSNTITLTTTPSASKHLNVSLNGQILTSSDYSVTGTTLTLANVNRELSDYIIVYYSY
jgi:hypothetical protein